MQPGRPPLRTLLQRTDVRRRQGQAHRPVEQCRRLILGETKIISPDLEQLAPRPQPGQRQFGIGPGGQGQADTRRQVLDQESHRTQHLLAEDQVIVIEYQRHRHRQHRQLVHQHGQHGVQAGGPRRGQHPRRRRAESGRHTGHAGDDVSPETDWVVVARIHRHPRGARSGVGQAPVPQQAGLPPARRGTDDHQPHPRMILAQAAEQGLTGHGPGPPGRRTQLGGEHQHPVMRATGTGRFPARRPRSTHPFRRMRTAGHGSSGLRYSNIFPAFLPAPRLLGHRGRLISGPAQQDSVTTVPRCISTVAECLPYLALTRSFKDDSKPSRSRIGPAPLQPASRQDAGHPAVRASRHGPNSGY